MGVPPVHKARSSSATLPSASSAAPSSEPTSSSEPPAAREADAALITEVTHAAQAALDDKKPDLARRCYLPVIAKAPEPAKAAFVIDVTFGADGKQVTFGISDVREALREDVSTCLRGERIELSIDPPGAHVRTQLTLSFP